MRMLKLWERLPYVVKIIFLALALVALVRIARADSTQFSLRQLNSLVRDGATPDTPAYGMMVMGYDGTSAQFMSATSNGYVEVAVGGGGSFGVAATDDAAFAFGTDEITPAGFVFDDTQSNDPEENDVALARMDSKRAVVGRVEGETRGVSADVLTLGADDTVNTTNGLWTYTALHGYESVGGVWDRVRMDTSGNLFVSLGTALDSSIDSVSIAVNDVPPQMDSTDRIAVSIYGLNSAAGDTQPTVTTTQASDLANTLDTLNVTSFLQGWDGTDWDRLSIFNFLAADFTLGDGTDDGLLGVVALTSGYDEDDTNVDPIYSYDTDGDNVATEAEGVTLATTGFNRVLDEAGTFDREKISHITGFWTPSTTAITSITADGGEDCTADDALAAGYYIIQTDAVAFCELNTSAAAAGATTADTRIENPGLYTIMAISGQDTLCCTVSSGTSTINITSVTFN